MTYKELKEIVSHKSLNMMISFIKENITDKRRKTAGNIIYSFETIIFIITIATICGISTYRGIEFFAKQHRIFFEKYITFPIKKIGDDLKKFFPSDDIYRLIIEVVDPDELFKLYTWITENIFNKYNNKTHISIDGKCPRGTKTIDNRSIDIVSAMNCLTFTIIDQEKVPEKKNEIPAILNLLPKIKKSGYKNPILSIDAIAAQPNLIEKICDSDCDYCIGFKENQKNAYIDSYNLLMQNFKNHFFQEYKEEHGKQEVTLYYNFTNLESVRNHEKFKGLKSIGAVVSYGYRNGEEFAEVRFYFVSFNDPNKFKRIVKEHWFIENNLHRSLDVYYMEDQSRIKKGNAPINFNILRKLGLVFLMLAKTYSRKSNITFPLLIDMFKIEPQIIDELLQGQCVKILC